MTIITITRMTITMIITGRTNGVDKAIVDTNNHNNNNDNNDKQ